MYKTVLMVMGKIGLYEVQTYYDGALDYYSAETDTYIRALGNHQLMNQHWAVWQGYGNLGKATWHDLFSQYLMYTVVEETKWSLDIGFFEKL